MGPFHDPTKPTDKRKKAQLTAMPTQFVGCEMILVIFRVNTCNKNGTRVIIP